MDVAKAEDALNDIIEAGVIAPPGGAASRMMRALEGEPFVSAATAYGTVVFEGEAARVLHGSLRLLLDTDKRLAGTLGAKDMQERVIEFLGDRFGSKAKVDRAGAKAFLDAILAEPVETYTVYRELFGGVMANKLAKASLGPFTVLHYPTHRAGIIDSNKVLHQWESGHTFEYAIGITVEARTTARAQTKADELFEQFEKTLAFFLGRVEHIEVGVLNYRGMSIRRAITVQDGAIVNVVQSKVGAYQPFPMDMRELTDAQATRVWSLLDPVQALSELQGRVLRAVQWVGEASKESSVQSAFLKAAIALELLLVGKDASFISQSITAKLAETVAMLLGRDANHRMDIEKLTKKLYGIRSAVAHTGNSSVGWSDVHQLLAIGRAAVRLLLEDETLRKLNSLEDVLALLNRRKYSFAGFADTSPSA